MQENLVLVEKFLGFGFFHQGCPVVRMGDFNERQRTFPDGSAVQMGHAVIRNNQIDRLPDIELVRDVLNGYLYVGFPF